MAAYIGIIRFDENTTRKLDQSPRLIEAAKETAKKIVATSQNRWESFYLLVPDLYIKVAAEAVDKEEVLQALLSFSAVGTIGETSVVAKEEFAAENQVAQTGWSCPQCGAAVKVFAPRHPPNIVGYSGREEDARWGNPHAGLMVECLIEDKYICTNLLCEYQEVRQDSMWVWHAD